ncbi:MAG: hypothetical protein AB1384_13920 [Actinomycetota bacterium]
MDDMKQAPGLSERLLREVIATPALKELILLQMKDIKPGTAPGLIRTLLWGDPGISMSLFGALPDMVNWLLELLLELGHQLNGLPEPLLKDILAQVGGGIDTGKLGEFPAVYGQLVRRILIGEGKSPEEVREAAIAAVNAALAGLDRLTARMDANRADIAASLAQGMREIDRAALVRSLRRVGQLAAAAARPPKAQGGGSKAPKAAAAAAGVVAALVVLRVVVKRIRG